MYIHILYIRVCHGLSIYVFSVIAYICCFCSGIAVDVSSVSRPDRTQAELDNPKPDLPKPYTQALITIL